MARSDRLAHTFIILVIIIIGDGKQAHYCNAITEGFATQHQLGTLMPQHLQLLHLAKHHQHRWQKLFGLDYLWLDDGMASRRLHVLFRDTQRYPCILLLPSRAGMAVGLRLVIKTFQFMSIMIQHTCNIYRGIKSNPKHVPNLLPLLYGSSKQLLM